MYDYLCETVDRLCAIYIKELGYSRYPAKLGDAYKKGASRILCSRLSEMQTERESLLIGAASASAGAGTSLVIFKKAQVDAEFGEVKYVNKAIATRKGDDVDAAIRRGRADGKNISLNTQIGPDSKLDKLD